MKPLKDYISEALISEKKLKDINDELAFWKDPKTEKEIIKETGLDAEFVHAAIEYLISATEDTIKMGRPEDQTIDSSIEYFEDGDFVEHFTGEGNIYKTWGGIMILSNEGELELDDAADLFAKAVVKLLKK